MISALLAGILLVGTADVPASLDGRVEVTRKMQFVRATEALGPASARPIVDALVAFETAGGRMQEARTDAGGRFSLPGLREALAADANLIVDHPLHPGLSVPLALLEAESGVVRIGLVRSSRCERRLPLVSVSRR